MSVEARKPPALFWAISIGLLLWALGGASIYAAYFVETPEEFAETAETAANSAAYAQYVADIPAWAIAGGMLAALTRLLGAICLLLRRVWALPLYVASTVLFVVALYRAFVLADVAEVMSTGHIGVEVGFLALGLFAIWFSHWAKSKGILR
jgi:hypothetical protein